MASEATLRVTEIFLSLQGEARATGLLTVFVRLTGCPLRCTYCDTEYAFTGGTRMSLDQVVDTVAGFGVKRVCVTGGEPLAQKSCFDLLRVLAEQDYEVSLETSGAMDIAQVDSKVSCVVDIKTPDSGEEARNVWSNVKHLRDKDQIKFVIASREDYDWAKVSLDEWSLTDRCEVLFSPVHSKVQPSELAQWIIDDRLPVRFQLQIHKTIWGDEPGR